MLSDHEKRQFLFKGCEAEQEKKEMENWINRSGIEKVFEVIINQFEDCPEDWTDPTEVVIKRNSKKSGIMTPSPCGHM